MTFVHFQGKSFNITVIQIYAPATSTEEAEVKQLYENLHVLPELTPKKKKKKSFLSHHITILSFYHRGWQCKVGSQELPRVIAKFGLGLQNEVVHRLTEFCQENTLVIANP